MEKKEKKAARIARSLDIPLDALYEVPRIELLGKSEINIENFRGILDYDENSFKINTHSGIVKIDGSGLTISSITDDNVCLRGTIFRLEFI